MEATRLLEAVGKRVQQREASIVLAMTPKEAEDLLDWMEKQGDFTVPFVCPSRLATLRGSVAVVSSSDASSKRR